MYDCSIKIRRQGALCMIQGDELYNIHIYLSSNSSGSELLIYATIKESNWRTFIVYCRRPSKLTFF